MCSSDLRDYDTAYRAFDAASKLRPKSCDALLSRAVAARGLEKFDEAETDYKKVIEMCPKSVGAHYNLGLLFQEYTQKCAEAITSFENVLRHARDAKRRKKATQRIQACRIQIQNMKEMETMMRQQKAQEEKEKAEAEKAKKAAPPAEKTPPPAEKTAPKPEEGGGG